MGNIQWRIVVVEDTFDDMQMVSKILRFHGVEVFVTRNGQECLELLQKLMPTLVITDLSMPGMDGWEMLTAIRANPLTAHLPVVAVTAYDSVDLAQDARSAGFDAYFPKPLHPLTIMEQLESLVAE